VRTRRLDEPLLQDTQVEAGAALGDQERRYPRVVHADPDAVARDAGLGDLELRLADAEVVADSHLVIVMRDVEGWPAEDVCAALAISEANQRVLLHRARPKVRTALEAYLEPAATAESVPVAA
jgi:DNA-directed RNA polymerase specialized sigma24 family protein